MSVNTRKGPIFDPGLCRCCGAIKKCRLLNVEYEWNGQKEVYSDMFMDCFGLLLSHLDGEAPERLICATCVCRLREASSFRRQVLSCEERLLTQIHAAEEESDEVKVEACVKEETVAIDTEGPGYDDDAGHIDNDTEEDILVPAKKPKRKKTLSQKVKRNKKSKTNKTDPVDAADAAHLDRDEKLPDFQQYKLQEPTQAPKQNGCRTESTRFHHNILTIVENSYACPFDTSFSDYFCVYCRQVFTDPHKLREHCLSHDPSTFRHVLTNAPSNKKIQIDVYRIDCRLCPERISDLDHFKHHITTHGKTLDSGSNDYLKFKLTPGTLRCTECDATFGFFHALKKHMAEHFGTCICDVCGAHYFEERMLVLHQKTHQKVEETFQCKECGKIFKSKYTRYIHIARTHKKLIKTEKQTNILKAMEAVEKGASISAAARQYGIARSTLNDKICGRSKAGCSKGPATVLSKEEEENLTRWIIFMADSGFPVTKAQLLDSASILVKKVERFNPFQNDRPGRHWFEAFLNRHPEVSQRMEQNLTQRRALVRESSLRLWFKEIKDYFVQANLQEAARDSRRIFSCDSSALYFSSSDANYVSEKECVKVLITANAAGELAPPMVLFESKSMPHKISETAPKDWGLGFTPKGWTGETFYVYMTNVFFPWIQKSDIRLPIIFFLDGHCSHTTLPLSNFCREKNIHLVALYPNSTHLIQPMNAVFEPLKRIWKKTVTDWRSVKLRKEDVCPLLHKSLEQLDSNAIKNGFHKCGLSPFDANSVDYSKCVSLNNTDKCDSDSLAEGSAQICRYIL